MGGGERRRRVKDLKKERGTSLNWGDGGIVSEPGREEQRGKRGEIRINNYDCHLSSHQRHHNHDHNHNNDNKPFKKNPYSPPTDRPGAVLRDTPLIYLFSVVEIVVVVAVCN